MFYEKKRKAQEGVLLPCKKVKMDNELVGSSDDSSSVQKKTHDLRIAVVCSSNQNRSMEAHARLIKKGFKVQSFGTGNKVKLPGIERDKPNVYDFSVSYEQMYEDLLAKDKAFYTNNGILHMLNRNSRIKSHPERFQLCRDTFDVIFTAEERIHDQVIEELSSRTAVDNFPVHIINIEIQDNHEEATIGALLICEMAKMMAKSDDLDGDIEDLIDVFETKSQRIFIHTIQFY